MKALLAGLLVGAVVAALITNAVWDQRGATAQLEEAKIVRDENAYYQRAQAACNVGLDVCERALGLCRAEGGCR